MKVIGITGGIASGKSTLARRLAMEKGVIVINADQLSKEISEEAAVSSQIIDLFGESIIDPETNALDRRKISKIIFTDFDKKNSLEKLIHPRVIEETRRIIASHQNQPEIKAVVIDAPLLIEAQMTDLCDEVWVIEVDPDVQMKRLLKRHPSIDRPHLQRIIDSQMTNEQRRPFATKIIASPEDYGSAQLDF